MIFTFKIIRNLKKKVKLLKGKEKKKKKRKKAVVVSLNQTNKNE